MTRPTIHFATSNPHKFREAKSILKGCGVNIDPLNLKIDEIRSESCAEVARRAAERAYSTARMPLFVEDTGLFIKALNGFPGTFSAWAFKKLGNEGIIRLVRGKRDRQARFVSAVAYCDSCGVRVFTGACDGSIAERAAGKMGFGYDPIFIPSHADGKSAKTFAEDAKFKQLVSHRRRALEKFGRWYLSYCKKLKNTVV